MSPLDGLVFTDGSCLDARDPELAVASWAVAWLSTRGWLSASGPVPGRQTASRAEGEALYQALLLFPLACTFVADCRTVADGFQELRRHECVPARLSQGLRGDL